MYIFTFFASVIYHNAACCFSCCSTTFCGHATHTRNTLAILIRLRSDAWRAAVFSSWARSTYFFFLPRRAKLTFVAAFSIFKLTDRARVTRMRACLALVPSFGTLVTFTSVVLILPFTRWTRRAFGLAIV